MLLSLACGKVVSFVLPRVGADVSGLSFVLVWCVCLCAWRGEAREGARAAARPFNFGPAMAGEFTTGEACCSYHGTVMKKCVYVEPWYCTERLRSVTRT